MEITIRNALNKDASAVKALEIECGLSPWHVEDYSAEVSRSESIFLVAVVPHSPERERVAGFLIMRLITIGENDSRPGGPVFEAEILNLAVSPSLRRNGLGGMLLAAGLREPVRGTIRDVFLEVRRSNSAARNFYRSSGFMISGERKAFYRDPPEDAVLMTAPADKVLARFPGNGLVFEL